MNDLNLTGGDLLPTEGTFLWEDSPTRRVWITRQGDNLIITTEAKVDAIIAQNAAIEAEFNYSGRHGDLVQIASVPDSLYFEWMRQGITDDDAKMKRILNDPDFAKFRTNRWTV